MFYGWRTVLNETKKYAIDESYEKYIDGAHILWLKIVKNNWKKQWNQ